MTIDTHGTGSSRDVMMMRGHVILTGCMLVAGSACFVTGRFQFQRVRVMAIGTPDSLMIHLALNERSINVNFIFDLAISEVGIVTE